MIPLYYYWSLPVFGLNVKTLIMRQSPLSYSSIVFRFSSESML